MSIPLSESLVDDEPSSASFLEEVLLQITGGIRMEQDLPIFIDKTKSKSLG